MTNLVAVLLGGAALLFVMPLLYVVLGSVLRALRRPKAFVIIVLVAFGAFVAVRAFSFVFEPLLAAMGR